VTLHNPPLLEIDPRPCVLCGLTIDHHEMVDDGEGPEFFCLPPDALTLPELERRAELIRQIEVAAIMARMEAAEVPCEPVAPPEPRPYRPAQSTVDAFWYVVRLDDVGKLKAWLADRPKDAPLLLALLESSLSC
jgi:hypothetical protein